jgi:putative spermidine/putrescine transport system substrate-binding protein
MKNIGRRTFLKGFAATGGALASASLMPMPAIAKDLKGTGEVVVYDGGGAWGEAKRLAYFEPFEAETGIKVIAEPRTEDGAIRASIMAGAPRYDVVILSGASSLGFARDGLLLPIDYSFCEQVDLDGFKTVPAGKFTLPHIIYSLLIAYDSEAFPNGAPESWADVWDMAKFPGGRTLGPGTWGADAATFETALLADGVKPADLYPLDFERAFKSLSKIKPHITKFWNSGAEGPQLIIDKQVSVGSAWNGRISAANEQGAKIGFTWNQGVLQYDNWMVPKGATNVENAWRFLAFTARPENQAKFVEHILYAPPNSNAYKLIAPERAKLLPNSPEAVDKQFVQNYEFWNTPREDGKPNTQYVVAEWEKWLAQP